MVDEDGKYVPYLDPDLNGSDDEQVGNNTVVSNVGLAANKPTEVFITDMKPGPESLGKNLEYSFRPLPNVSDRFKITGVWVGPAHWKFKYVRRPNMFDKPKTILPKPVKTVKHSRKCRPFECMDASIVQIKANLATADRKTTRNTKNTEAACTLSEYMEVVEDRGATLMNRPRVKVQLVSCAL